MTSPPGGCDGAAVNHGAALVRRPSSRLAEGIVTHVARTHVDIATAERQHEANRAALSGAGWTAATSCTWGRWSTSAAAAAPTTPASGN
jgi:hypothetical protein